MTRVYLGLGSNLGDRIAHLREAVCQLELIADAPIRRSSVYETLPVGYLDQPKFLNAAVVVDTYLTPDALLLRINQIEESVGRVRSFVNAPRQLDIDILLCGDIAVHETGLEIPHPRMLERAFVVVPLLELDRNARLPDGATVAKRAPAESLQGPVVFLRGW